jgi:hypothetical protein
LWRDSCPQSGISKRHDRSAAGVGIKFIGSLAIFPFKQVVISKKPFSPHDVNSIVLLAIKNPHWWNDKLAMLCAFEFGWH